MSSDSTCRCEVRYAGPCRPSIAPVTCCSHRARGDEVPHKGDHDRHTLARRCRSLVDAFRGRPLPVEEARGDARRPSRPAGSMRSPSSTRHCPGQGRHRRRAPPLRRGALRGEGTQPLRGLARHRGVPGLRGPQSRTYTATSRRASGAARRGRAGGPHHRIGVRRAQRQHHQAQRRHRQPLAARRARPAGPRAAAQPPWRAGWSPSLSGGDGGGSIRIPAGFNGQPGMKGTAGRIPRGPEAQIHP